MRVKSSLQNEGAPTDAICMWLLARNYYGFKALPDESRSVSVSTVERWAQCRTAVFRGASTRAWRHVFTDSTTTSSHREVSKNTPTVSWACNCNPNLRFIEHLLWFCYGDVYPVLGGFGTVLKWAVPPTFQRIIQPPYWGPLRELLDWSINFHCSWRWAHIFCCAIACTVHFNVLTTDINTFSINIHSPPV